MPEDGAGVKAALRDSALRARRVLSSDERDLAAHAAAERLLALPPLRRPGTVLVYAAMRDEIDPAPAFDALTGRGARLLFPRVVEGGLEAVAATDLRTLTSGYRGIREPSGPAVDPEQIDIVIVPGVAFDPNGGRLGHGGGHYDRLLAVVPASALRVGLAFACQMVPRVPREDHDLPVDLVVTERGLHRAPLRDLDEDGPSDP